MIVLPMVRKNYRLTQDKKDAAASLNLPLAKTGLILRQFHVDAPGQRAMVWHLDSRAQEAAEEVVMRFRELLPQAVKVKPAKRPAKLVVTA